MKIAEFVKKLEKLNLSLVVKQEKLVLEGDESKLSLESFWTLREKTDIINFIKQHKKELIAHVLLSNNHSFNKNSKSIESMYRLSGLQEGMLFHGLYDEQAGSYVEQFSCEITDVDLSVFQESWHQLLKRHSVLRSSFHYDEFSIPVQCVHREVEIPIEILDYRDLGEVEQESAIRAYQASDRRRGFDFKSAPLMRVVLIQVSSRKYRMIWTHHHILLDGWSLPVMMKELLSVYESLVSGDPLPLIEEDRYEDYIRYIECRNKEKEEDYWRGYLGGLESSTLLPFIAAATTQRNKGIGLYGQEHLQIDPAIAREIEKYIQEHHITMNTLMQGVWSYLLHQYTGNSSITYGVTVSGRPDDLPGVEDRVGMYINTLPLHSVLEAGDLITDWLQKLQQGQLESREYQHTALSDIQKWTNVPGDLFDSLLVFENYPVSKVISSREWSLQVDGVEVNEQVNYPLSISITADKEINISFSYNNNLLSEEAVHRIAGHFGHVLKQIIGNKKEKLGELEMLTPDERTHLLEGFNDTNAEYPRDKTVMDLFEAQVLRTPEAVAVVYEGQELSYRELNERSNQLGHFIKERFGVCKGERVVVFIERSEWVVVVLLSLLRSGITYVPVDSNLPKERVRFIIDDVQPSLIISENPILDFLGDDKFRDITIKSVLNSLDGYEVALSADIDLLSNDEAYIIYTSGSMGKPKGVMVTHGNLDHFCNYIHNEFTVSGLIKLPFMASVSFDISIFQLLAPLLGGGTSIIVDEPQLQDLDKLINILLKVTVIDTVPGIYNLIVNYINERNLGSSFGHIQRVVIGGDRVPDDLLRKLTNIFNSAIIKVAYGPTEGTIFCTDLEYLPGSITAESKGSIIGRPIGDGELYILGNGQELSPIGVGGEICIGGAGVARGYLNRPELTSEKFINNPFSSEADARIYRTGDLGRWLPDGNIEFLGRIDDQVKIRGYRIELGEIESVLGQCEQVSSCVVLAREDKHGNKRLVGYIVPRSVFNKESILSYLGERLPEYMIPSILVELCELPLTSNGKVNRKGLPDPDVAGILLDQYVAPGTETEEKLVTIWQELLGLDRVGVHDNFFELGGDSIITIQLVSRMKRSGYEVKPKDIFVHQTISRLSVLLTERKGLISDGYGEQGILTGSAGLLPIQQWYLESAPEEVSYFNQSVLLTVDKGVTAEAMERVVRALVEHHDGLRFVYSRTASGWEQSYSPEIPVPFFTEKVGPTLPELFGLITRDIANKYQADLNIEQGDLLRVVLLETDKSIKANRLLIVIHHLVVDGVSWRILLDDVELLLGSLKRGEKLGLGRKSSSYRQWYNGLADYGKSKALLSQRGYWEKIIGSYVPLREDKAYTDGVRVGDTGNYKISLSSAQTQVLLQEVSGVYHTEINDLLLCALAETLCQWNGSDKIVIGLEGHGREVITESLDTGRTVGWFTNLYPVLLETGQVKQTGDLIKSIKEQLRQVPDKGMGYGVLKYINKDSDLQGSAPWDLMFNYLGQLDNIVSSSEWFTGSEESSGNEVSKSYKGVDKLSVNSMVQGGALVLNWGYSIRHYDQETIQKLAAAYVFNLEALIRHCVEQSKIGRVYTPSDYGLGEAISYEQLDAFLAREKKEGESAGGSIESMYRLSGLQEGMLFHGLYDEQAGSYVEQFSCEITDVDLSVFQESWHQLLKRHSVLRSSFHYDEFSIPVQCVHREVEIPIEILDYRDLGEVEQESAIRAYQASDRRRGFDFKSAPLMRVVLIQVSSRKYRMIWTHHHILLDGWSLPVMMKELLSVYESLVSGDPLPLIEEDRYEDYIRYIECRNKEKEEDYWRGYLGGLESSTLLPFIAAATTQRNKGIGLYGQEHLQIDPAIAREIEKYIQEHHITMNTLMQGVWSYLLHQYTGNSSITYGVTVSGRPDDLPGVEDRVGMYINTLPLHSVLEAGDLITDWLQKLQQGQLESREYQHTALSDIQKWTNVPGDLFDSLLVFENYPVSKVISSREWSLQVDGVEVNEQVNYPLSISITADKEINISFSYNNNLLSEEAVHRIAGHFGHVLKQIIGNKKEKLGELEMLTPDERTHLLEGFNDTNAEYPRDKTVMDLFEAQVLRTPEAVAVVYEGQELSYRELNERSNQLGHYLRGKGVKAETLVPICIERSLEMLIGILGIMKAGGGYVPIDPEYPADRINYMLEDTGGKVIVSSGSQVSVLPQEEGLTVIELDTDWHAISREPVSNISSGLRPSNLAYVIYTSGSTGRPKGVMIEHGNVVNYLLNNKTHYLSSEKNTGGSVLNLSYTFDASITAMFMPLLWGKMLVLSGKSLTDIFEDTSLLKNSPYDFIKVTPAQLGLLESKLKDQAYDGLTKKLVIGGEELKAGHIENLYGIDLEIVNEYGPTEATVGCSTYTFNVKDGAESIKDGIPIGRPISNTQIYILNKEGKLSPIGVGGEICIGGAGVARGYLNRPELTSEKFINNPFSSEADARIYRTGDLGRWLPDGNIEFLGRIDDQVKIRGYRIELGEIESVLGQCEQVSSCVVLAREDKHGNKRLVGYIVPRSVFNKESILSYLGERLPEYMIPSILVELCELPLTSNGKVNRKGLPDPDVAGILLDQYVAPGTETEEKLVTIWQELLGLDRVGVHDNFFELGGDSIITIQLVSRMKRSGYEVKPKDIFVHQTISRLSVLLTERKGLISDGYGEQGILTGSAGLLPIQQWYLESAPEEVSYFNQSVLLTVDKGVTAEAMERVVRALVEHHDGLRFVYSRTASGWEQSYSPEIPVPFFTEKVGPTLPELFGLITRDIANKYQADLNIEQGDLLRVVLLETDKSIKANRLLIVIHHLVVDGVSWRILLDDVELLLGSLKRGEKLGLGRKSSSYRQWYNGLADYGKSKALLSQRGYWEKIIGSYVPLREDKAYTDGVRVGDTGNYKISLSSAQTQVLLQEVSGVYHTEINDLLLCALAETLCQWNGSDKIVIGLEGHGREVITESLDTGRTVGWFTNLYPVLLETGQVKQTGDLIKSIKEQLRQVPDKGMGYGVLKYINKDSDLQGSAPWDLMFNYLGQLDNIVSSSEWFTGSEESSGNEVSKSYKGVDKLSVNSMVQGGALVLNWGYSIRHYDQETIQKLAAAYVFNLEALIRHCVEQSKIGRVYTPSDYGLGEAISYEQLDAFLAREKKEGESAGGSIESMYRLSGLQEGMLFHGLYDEQAGSYVEQFSCEITDVDLSVFQESWHQLLKRHSVLRSSFHYDEFSIPVQCVHREVEIPIEILDYRDLGEVEQESAIRAYQASDRRRGFDFKSAPLMRVVLIQVSSRKYRMIWTHHHILLDGWSLPVMMKELLSVYESLVSGDPLPLIEEDRYEDYIRYIECRNKEKEEDYWRGYLGGLESSTLLPFIAAATTQRNKGIGLYGQEHLQIDPAIAREIEKYIQEHHITMNTLMQGVWSYLLHQYTGNSSITYGVTVSGRPDDLPGVEDRVGMYINTLPLHSVLEAGDLITDWLQKLQQGQLESREYQHTALSDIQKWTNVPGDLFDSLLVFENYPVSKVISSREWSLQVDGVEVNEQVNYPLSISITADKEINISFSYNNNLLSEEAVHRIAGHFGHVLKQIIGNKKEKLGELEMLTPDERTHLLEGFNDTNAEYPRDKTVMDLFEAQVLRTPEAVAVVYEGQELSYRELNERSNQLGHYLRGKGVKAETLVPICIERSLEMLIGILGIMKAGGGYVPIDPEYPADRINYMLEDTGGKVIVSSGSQVSVLPQEEGLTVIELDTDWHAISREPVSNISSGLRPSNLAYVIYTSGSTGRPKGVMIEHGGLMNRLLWAQDYYRLTSKDSVLQKTSFCFDVSVWEFLWPLLVGSRLVIAKPGGHKESAYLRSVINDQKITMIHFVPSMLMTFLSDLEAEECQSLSKVLCSGEELKKAHAELFTKQLPHAELHNLYGPTEASIEVTHWSLPDQKAVPDFIPIGRPISNTQIYILNKEGKLSPIGVGGEICIGGAGVARGYLNRPELTSEKFINNPFSSEADARIYRTGDLGRWLPDGNIEFLGRIDDQVKIRGYRIELGEIESVLGQCEQVSSCVVLAREDKHGNKRLVGYIVPRSVFNKESILSYLGERLPEYMIPSILVELCELPLTSNGKVNRKGLPDPDVAGILLDQYVAPGTETEEKLVTIWQELLGLDRVGVHDNFFELGGHSLLAMKVASVIKKEFKVELSIKTFFQIATINTLAGYIEICKNNVLVNSEGYSSIKL